MEHSPSRVNRSSSIKQYGSHKDEAGYHGVCGPPGKRSFLLGFDTCRFLIMNDVTYKEITDTEDDQRLDNYLFKTLKGVPKSHIYRIIRSGEVRINKKRAKASSRVHQGDLIRIPPVRISEQKEVFVSDTLAKRLKDCIIYEDTHLLVLNKPAGIAVHGGSGLSLGIIEALRKTRQDLHYLELIHRLDKETSGCLLIAKKRSALRAIHDLLEKRKVQKTYWALLCHTWNLQRTVLVRASLEKNILKSGERMVSVNDEGKDSETEFILLENFDQACFIEAKPKTGRTHQIRVHSAYLGHPIIGDEKYGAVDDTLEGVENHPRRLFLHARSIQFEFNGQVHIYTANPDERFNSTLDQLRTRSIEING